VSTAALCHDIGHGPFSHVFDNVIIPKLQAMYGDKKKWTHEIGGTIIFKDLLAKTPKVAALFENEKDRQMVQDLILGNGNAYGDRKWLFEIVSNSRNGIDVDKFDYLARDTQKMNVHYCSFNRDIVMKGARVIDNQICYPEKHEFEVKKLYDSRYNLYKDCYCHRVT